MSKEEQRAFLTLEEVAEELSVNYQLIYRLVRAGSLPAVRLGRIYRVRRADLDAYLANQTVGGDGGFNCGACGTYYSSGLSKRGTCEKTGKPICLVCWDRKGIRSCEK